MITCLIIEDEKPARDRLKSFIETDDLLGLSGEAENGIGAIKLINQLKPRLIFLDVKLPDLSGLDVLKIIEYKPFVIFTTAYDEYALSAFQHNAVDYLLKPFSLEQFNRAVSKVKARFQIIPDVSNEINKLLNKFNDQANLLSRIPAKIGEKIYILNTDDILYFKSKDKVVFAHLAETYFIINYTLDELAARLNNDQFIRIHRSTIVNLNFVHTIEPYGAGTFLMHLKDKRKTDLRISRNSAREIREKLGW